MFSRANGGMQWQEILQAADLPIVGMSPSLLSAIFCKKRAALDFGGS